MYGKGNMETYITITWQLSDLAFNTLGGVIGGLIYWVSAKIRKV